MKQNIEDSAITNTTHTHQKKVLVKTQVAKRELLVLEMRCFSRQSHLLIPLLAIWTLSAIFPTLAACHPLGLDGLSHTLTSMV